MEKGLTYSRSELTGKAMQCNLFILEYLVISLPLVESYGESSDKLLPTGAVFSNPKQRHYATRKYHCSYSQIFS